MQIIFLLMVFCYFSFRTIESRGVKAGRYVVALAAGGVSYKTQKMKDQLQAG
jgi:hypothetical protein